MELAYVVAVGGCLLIAAAIGLVVAVSLLTQRNARLAQEKSRLASENTRLNGENARLNGLVSPLKALPHDLVTLLSVARGEGMVQDKVVESARTLLQGKLPIGPELQTLQQRLSRQEGTRSLGPVAAAEVQRIERELVQARSNGYQAVLIGSFEYGEHPRLGHVQMPSGIYRRDDGDYGVTYSGPVKQIVEYLRKQGLGIQVTSDLRYANHPDGGGLAYKVVAVMR